MPQPACGTPGFTLLQSESDCPVLGHFAGQHTSALTGCDVPIARADTTPLPAAAGKAARRRAPWCERPLPSRSPPSGAMVSGWSSGIRVGRRVTLGVTLEPAGRSLLPAVREALSPPHAEAALPMNIQQYPAPSLRGSPAAPPSLSPTTADGGLAVFAIKCLQSLVSD